MAANDRVAIEAACAPVQQVLVGAHDNFFDDDFDINPIFASSVPGCDNNAAFHAACDDKGPTISAVTLPSGAIIGGFTTQSWRNIGYIVDTNSCVFRIAPDGTVTVWKASFTEQNGHIHAHNGHAVTFGFAHTIYANLDARETSYVKDGGGFPVTASAMLPEGTLANFLHIFVFQVIRNKRPRADPIGDYELRKERVKTWALSEEARRIGLMHANLISVGEKGEGKSSLLNAMISAMAGRTRELAKVLPSSDHVTKGIDAFKLSSNVMLWDPWGAREDYVRDMEMAVSGRLKSGTKWDNVPLMNDPALLQAPTFQDEMHCVVVAYSYSHVNEATYPDVLERTRALLRMLEKYQVPVVVFMTKSDKAAGVRPDLGNFHNCKTLENAQITLARLLGVEQRHVVCVTSPTGQGRVISEALERASWAICLKALHCALNLCLDFYQNVEEGRVVRRNLERGGDGSALVVEDGQNGALEGDRMVAYSVEYWRNTPYEVTIKTCHSGEVFSARLRAASDRTNLARQILDARRVMFAVIHEAGVATSITVLCNAVRELSEGTVRLRKSM